jgi:steroid delta-isomerase-like uncharacterized protein
MSEHETVLTRFYDDVLGRADREAAASLIADSFVDHNPNPLQEPGRDGLLAAIERIRSAFPDLVYEVQLMIAEGPRTAVQWRMQGTNTGSLFGAPPSDKPIDVTGVDIFRVDDGQIAERWSRWETLKLLGQIGMTPPSTRPGP